MGMTTAVSRQTSQTAGLYRGVLDAAHLRAVLRSALMAHGFEADANSSRGALKQELSLGGWLRDGAFPAHLPAYADAADYRAIADADPYLWERILLMSSLGYRQAAAIQRLAGAPPATNTAVHTLGAAFNVAIAATDYVLDERLVESKVLFDVLTPELLIAIFRSPGTAGKDLGRAYRQATDLRLRLVITMVGICADIGMRLYRATGNDRAWAALGEKVGRMFVAERRSADPGLMSSNDALEVLEIKSTYPSIALLYVSTVASGVSEPPPLVHRAVHDLGKIFSRVDDAVDLLSDDRRGLPNVLSFRIAERLRARASDHASDADLYDAIDEAASEIVASLDSIRDLSGRVASHEAATGFVNFARLTIANWSDWSVGTRSTTSNRQWSFGKSDSTSQAVRQAVALLLKFQKEGYADAAHHLRFPRLSPFGVRYETHAAILSHRAVALDALLDAVDAGVPVPSAVLNAEAMALLQAKHREVRGGWNYIPAVPELPPDADDLGQVLQELMRLGGQPLAFTCEEAIRLALDGAGPDGSFSTWIVDPRGSTRSDDRVREYLAVMGGWGVHPEVVANLVFGLGLYDRLRYRTQLQRACGYLKQVQGDDGAWTSRWYAGPYYGTYKAVAALCLLTSGDSSLERARQFLLATQHRTGQWGEGGGSALDTGLALLTLTALGMNARHASVRRAKAFLLETQNPDGGWARSTWIAFPTLDGPEEYGSRAITTAFCLRALLSVRGRSPVTPSS